MRLSRLIEGLDLTVLPAPDATDPEIRDLAVDSREVRPGSLFGALPGTRVDGSTFVDQAIAAGAVAVLGGPPLAGRTLDVSVLAAPDPAAALARLAARFFGRQPAIVAAVTGTNGKTSVASFTRQLWALSGHKSASIGTLGVQSTTGDLPGNLTTPDVLTLQRLAAELAGSGVERLVIEASSHGLEQRRVDGLRITAAAFTNLTRDHLDHHGDMAAYLAAKRRLFAEVLAPDGIAVLNADMPEFPALAAVCAQRGIRVIDYGHSARVLRLVEQRPEPGGQGLVLALSGQEFRVASSLVGGFQAENLLAAVGLWQATGGDPIDAVRLIPQVVGAPGRMQLVGATPGGAAVYVDYAHTPDALEKALAAARPHVQGRLFVVFGCGGDRDPGKRPLMGRVAAERADVAIVTDDNPRGEDPAAIRAAALKGMPAGAREIGDRALAIRTAVSELRPGDLLLIAGKGHERGQTIRGVTHPFDDAEVARAALAELAPA
ncbi:UDP-N-acetylmuramoyl-L-alanyl-D-glutamate--2,6-diaminopimelate ligase [Geminicoccus flavidas]|uniref:UDP-N-acetylmuramoyl-L-alanyl-D-glutamate--2, 6-diaminopimelate ligase n=1 Tax=Geminicoccus flavidas TaxID=2506407 RepID=UPI001F2FCDFE|nr:UDP-N-acetylmuramoyl-L-alanyl-D-glutamate--2,6-diaminopimelate ligase [Geminicoccus flavidas]